MVTAKPLSDGKRKSLLLLCSLEEKLQIRILAVGSDGTELLFRSQYFDSAPWQTIFPEFGTNPRYRIFSRRRAPGLLAL